MLNKNILVAPYEDQAYTNLTIEAQNDRSIQPKRNNTLEKVLRFSTINAKYFERYIYIMINIYTHKKL